MRHKLPTASLLLLLRSRSRPDLRHQRWQLRPDLQSSDRKGSRPPRRPDSHGGVKLGLNMLKHGKAGMPMEVMGLMLGEFVDDYTVKVVDVFAMPQSGTGVSVEAVDHVFQMNMLDMLKQTGRYRPFAAAPLPRACLQPRLGFPADTRLVHAHAAAGATRASPPQHRCFYCFT